MDCPRCLEVLLPKFAGDVEIDVCCGPHGCGGWWLDSGELGKLVARGHRMGPAAPGTDADPPGLPEPILKPNAVGDPDASVGFRDLTRPSYAPTKMHCPRDGATLMEVGVGGEMVITVDKCPQCGGFWLDAGELDKTAGFIKSRIGDRLPADLENKLDKRWLFDERGTAEQRPKVNWEYDERDRPRRKRKHGGLDLDGGDMLESVGQFALLAVVFNVIGELFD